MISRSIQKKEFQLPITFGTEIQFKVVYNPELVVDPCKLAINLMDEDQDFRLFKAEFKIKEGNRELVMIQGSRFAGEWVEYENNKAQLENVVPGENQIRIVVGEEKFQVYINNLLYPPCVLTDRLEYFEDLTMYTPDAACFSPIADSILLIHHSDKGT